MVYGMLVKAMSPNDDDAAPPLRVVSPFQSCHAHQPADELQPSGWKLCADRMTYCDRQSLEKVRLPWASVLDVPQPDPQKTRYTLGAPVVTPMPSTPPPYRRLAAEAVMAAPPWPARHWSIWVLFSR